MKNVTKLAKKSAGLSQKCSICPLMKRCTLEIQRACFDSFVEGFKKGARAAEKGKNKKFKTRIDMNRIQLHKSIHHVTTANGKLSDKTIKLINKMAKKAYGSK